MLALPTDSPPSTSNEVDPWRAMLRVLFAVHLTAAMGFSMVMPFLPLYVRHLGVRDPDHVALWSGMVFSAPALTMMAASPLWGWLADRHGRKLMLLRSTLGGAVIVTAMGFVDSVESLALLRALQGAITGYLAASNALVAASIPPSRIGSSYGYLRTGTWVGTGIGPLVGGALAESLGPRAAFDITGGLLLASGLLVLFVVREPPVATRPAARRGFLAAYRLILSVRGLRKIYSLAFLDALGRSMVLPILPLFLIHLLGGSEGVALWAGVVFGARAVAGAVTSPFVGHLGDRIGHGRVVTLAAVGMAIVYLPQALVSAAWQLAALQILSGLIAVGVVPGIGALLSLYVPDKAAGATFGLESSVSALARVLGPMLGAGVAAVLSHRAVFGAAGAVFVGLALLAWPLRAVRAAATGGKVVA